MNGEKISKKVVVDRLAWVDRMLEEIRKLPLDTEEDFAADSRNVWTAESCLRRALESLLDLGRHILARGFGIGVGEYKEISRQLEEHGVLDKESARLLHIMAGYRNRMVHFYHEVTYEELCDICRNQLGDIEAVADAYRRWLRENPDKIDESL